MLKALGSRLSYANVMATVAVFVAFGGGAYALTGIPDRSGTYHGCADPKTGALRVVKAASSCRKAKTVRRGRRRVHIPGELAIAWNQQGRPGAAGINGVNGNNGTNGATNVVVRTTTDPPTTASNDEADCNPGERAVAGGVSRADGSVSTGDVVNASFPSAGAQPAPPGTAPTAWHSSLKVVVASSITHFVVCASP